MKRKVYGNILLMIVSLLVAAGCGGKKSSDSKKEKEAEEAVEEKVSIASISDSKIISILPSSTLRDEKISYKVGNIFDGSPGAGWCEGKTGSGVGESITISFDKLVTINNFYIMNGIADTKYYRGKNRIQSMKINGLNVKLADSPYVQAIKLPKPVTSNKISFTITGIYKGMQDEDTCISELSFSKLNISPVKTIVFPITVSRDGYKITLMDEGKLNVTGIGLVDCPAVFVKGEWENNARGDYVVKYTVKSDKMCGNINAIRRSKSWDFNRMQTVFSAAYLKRVMRF